MPEGSSEAAAVAFARVRYPLDLSDGTQAGLMALIAIALIVFLWRTWR